MKKLSILKAFLAASALALLVPGCSGIDGGYETAVENSSNIKNGKVALNLSIGDGYASLRTALPSAEDIALSQYTYALSAKSGEAEKIYLFGSATEGIEYAKAISAKAAYIEEGTYDFELIAFKEGKAILAGALNGKEITATSNTLSFRMYAADSDSQTGSLAITVTYPTDMGVAVTSTTAENETTITAVPGVKAELFSDASCSGTGTALSVIGTGNDGAFETGKVLVAATDISAGKSFVKITLSDGTETIGSAVEAVYAVEGMVSSSEVAVEAEKFLATVKLQDATIATAKEIKVKAVVDGAEKGDFISLSVVDGSDNKNYQAYLTAGLSYNVYVGDAKKDGVVISDVTTKEFYAEKDLSAIEIAWASGSAPTDLYVNQTDLNDVLLGLINVTKKYSNGESDTPVLANTLDATLTVASDSTAEQTVNVTLDGKTAATGLALTLNADELDSIAVTQVPTNVSYKQNELFAPAGMKITATYKSKNEDEYVFTDNGITKNDVALDGDSPFSFSPENFRATTFADSEETANVDVTISMIDGSVTKTATQTVTVTKVNEMLPYEFDFNLLAKSGDSTGATNITADTNTTYDGGVILVNGSGKDGNLRIRKTVNGDTATYAFNVQNNNASGSELPSINSTVASLPAFYIGVDISSTETLASNVLVSFNVKATGSNKGSADAYVFLVDNNKKILASMVLSEVSGTTAAGILSGTVTDLSSKVYLGFSRGSGTGGGIDITGITVVDPDKIQSAPDATKFNTVSATLNADDGKIAVSEALSNDNGAKLEYKLSSANEWTEATASIENLAAGVYEFRYAALSDGSKNASPSVSVTVFGAKSLELPATLYSVTPKAEGGVVSATTTVATAELSEDKVAVKSVAAGTSDITLTDAHGNVEKVTVTVSAIGEISAKNTQAIGKIVETDSIAVTSTTGTSPLTVAKGDSVTLTATPTIAASNPEKLTYQWYSKAASEENATEIDGATSATYAVDTSSAGTVIYSVKVTGTVSGKNLTSAGFSVKVADLKKLDDSTVVTVTSSASDSVEVGTEVTLTANIADYNTESWESVTYQWNKGDKTIDGATGAEYTYTTTADDVAAQPSFIVTVTGTSSKFSVTSSAASIKVTKKTFTAKLKTISNDEATLGLTATTVSSSNTDVATVEKTEAGIVITSVAEGTATITFADGTNSGTIAVTVGAGGDITYVVNKYTPFVTTILDWSASSVASEASYTSSSTEIKLGDLALKVGSGTLKVSSAGISWTGGYFSIGSSDGTTGTIPTVAGYNIKLTVTASLSNANSSKGKKFQYGIDKVGSSGLTNWVTVDKSSSKESTDYTATNTDSTEDAKHFFGIRAESGLTATITAIKIEYVEAE